jgi:hypothetical protein
VRLCGQLQRRRLVHRRPRARPGVRRQRELARNASAQSRIPGTHSHLCAQKCCDRSDLRVSLGRLRGLVALIDHAAEYLPALHRRGLAAPGMSSSAGEGKLIVPWLKCRELHSPVAVHESPRSHSHALWVPTCLRSPRRPRRQQTARSLPGSVPRRVPNPLRGPVGAMVRSLAAGRLR